MTARIHDEFEQLSADWWYTRRGLPSASNFDRICTPKQGKLAAAHHGYICELIGDRYDPLYPRDHVVKSVAIAHGIEYEPESRRWYEFETSQTVRRVGLVISACGRFCCSPDGLIGEDGGLELKNPQPATHVGYLLDPDLLLEDYKHQVYGSLLVTGRQWWDIVSYCPGLPGVRARVEAGVLCSYKAALQATLEQFHENYLEALSKVQQMEAAA
jgi:YqaJ-like recombinase protein